jgi:hypothetical protein
MKFVVNPKGVVHSVSDEEAKRLLASDGFRAATKEEIDARPDLTGKAVAADGGKEESGKGKGKKSAKGGGE